MNLQTLQDLLKLTKTFNQDNPAISWHQNDERFTYNFRAFNDLISDYTQGFLALGLTKGDRVAIFSSNLPQWLILTLAINNAGLIDVPRGENSTVDEISYIVEHSKAKIVIMENDEILAKLNQDQHKDLHHVYSIKPSRKVKNISDLAMLGQKSKKIIYPVLPTDTASIIYTSGTTGVPKGVELSHGNFASQINAILKRIQFQTTDKCISVLPAWHAFERIVKYCILAVGIETFYTNSKNLMDDLVIEQPTVMASVPRIWEMIYDRIMKKLKKGGGFKKIALEFACSASVSYAKCTKNYNPFKLAKIPFHFLLEKAVYSELRKRLGGRLRFAISGGSSLPNYIDDFFHAAKVEILEGYGLTETSPVISVRVPGAAALYSAGLLIDQIQAKVINSENGKETAAHEEGILYVKGPNVMKGYYRNYEETKKVLSEDGWFDTGDRAFFRDDHNLIITGREKDIIVLSNGENINPVPIETALTKSEFITTAIVAGQDWRMLSALIVPDLDNLKIFCDKYGIFFHEDNLKEIFTNPLVYDLFKREINRYVNSKNGFKAYERIQDFRFAKPFNIGKELTLTLKPKRILIEELYHQEIESMRASIHKSL